MASIAHLSDVHFGRHDPLIVEALEALLAERKPDLVVISGDFTQRARVEQYRLASLFLGRLKSHGLQVLGVPGNHDVPLFDLFRRFARPLSRYRRFIDKDLCPWFENETLAVLGINTARSFTVKDGRISHEQMNLIREKFRNVGADKTRILVTHHPLFAMPLGEEGEALTEVVGRHEDALEAVSEAGVHILLAGHFHRSFSKSAREMVENTGAALVVQAGTATSNRLRGDEKQSFNWIEATNRRVTVQVHAWEQAGFKPGKPTTWVYDGGNWGRVPDSNLDVGKSGQRNVEVDRPGAYPA